MGGVVKRGEDARAGYSDYPGFAKLLRYMWPRGGEAGLRRTR